MFDEHDKDLLIRSLTTNQAVLFLGSGFSSGAKNRRGLSMPVGHKLSEDLWKFLAYKGEYDSTDLPTLFEAALRSPKGHTELQTLLEDQLLCSSIPSWYETIKKIFWYRIYTTNIDDLVETIYKNGSGEPKLDRVVAPHEDFRERDQFLRSIQYVKLNGSLPSSPKQITFSTRQYARRSGEHDTWYDHFVRDYSTHVTILIGTNLNEPLFWQYIEVRDRKIPGAVEHRRRSFLICPVISPAKREMLSALNIVGVEANAEQFLTWIESTINHFPGRRQVLEVASPSLAAVFDASSETLPPEKYKRLERFYECFEPVRLPIPVASHRKLYLLGASPGWQDLAHEFDAPRATYT